ncbi:hypothetical protein QTN25_001319 [Entamoeba marina]
MNVLLYIENGMILTIPQISKKCKNACDAMKINPWKNPTTPLQDIQNIKNIFPFIQTLRVDIKTIHQYENEIDFDCFENIEIIKNSPFHICEVPSKLRSKAHIAFKEKYINKTVYKVYLNHFSITTSNIFQKYSNIRYLFLIFSSPPTLNEVNILNKYSYSISITIKLLKDDIVDSLYIVPQEEPIDFCLYPLESINNMKLFEKYYLPTKLRRINNQQEFTDLTRFKYVKCVTLIPSANTPKNYIQLPTSTEDIVVEKFNKVIDHTEIINWKDLNNLQRIQDHHQLYIPYPQIKKKKKYHFNHHPNMKNLVLSFQVVV